MNTSLHTFAYPSSAAMAADSFAGVLTQRHARRQTCTQHSGRTTRDCHRTQHSISLHQHRMVILAPPVCQRSWHLHHCADPSRSLVPFLTCSRHEAGAGLMHHRLEICRRMFLDLSWLSPRHQCNYPQDKSRSTTISDAYSRLLRACGAARPPPSLPGRPHAQPLHPPHNARSPAAPHWTLRGLGGSCHA